MTFGRPLWLLLLALPVLWVAWETRRAYPRIVLPLDHGEQGSGIWWGRLLACASVLPALLLTVAILLFCRPLVQALPKQERKLTNIEFVLDVSGSMTSSLGEGSRYDAAMEAIELFTTKREGDAFGLTIFGNEVLRWTPLTKDLSAIRHATPFLRPEDLPHHFGGTEIGKAVLFSQRTLADRGEGDRMIVLLSDGQSADLGGPKARQIGAELAEDNVVLYAIHVGSYQAPSDLYDLALPNGGEVFAAENPESLHAIFARIDQMRPVEMKPGAPEKVDLFWPFALAGLVVLGVYQFALLGLRYTPW